MSRPSPPEPDPHAITESLRRWSHGDAAASEKVFEMLYEDLRSIAARHLRGERRSHTLQTTALVNEVFLRYQARSPVAWESRAQFLAYSARVIRQVLVDYARRRNRLKRGPGAIYLDEAALPPSRQPVEVIELHDALNRLAESDPIKAAIVELRFFGGLTADEIGEALDLSAITVRRHWRRARAWLFVRLSAEGAAPEGGGDSPTEQRPAR